MVQLSSTLPLLLLLLLVSVRAAADNFPSEDGREATQFAGAMTSKSLAFPTKHSEETTPNDNSTTATDGFTTTTDEATAATDGTTTTTDETTTTTDETTTTTDETTTTTDETTTTTDETTTDTVTDRDSTTTTPIDGLDLYQETSNELQLINEVLDKFTNLVNSEADAAPAAASGRSVQKGRGHPAAWWLRGEAARLLDCNDNFCVRDDNDFCQGLDEQLKETDILLTYLRVYVDSWQNSNLTLLQKQREELNNSCNAVEKNLGDFLKSIYKDKFIQAIDVVKLDLRAGQDTVQDKMAQLDPPSNPGSVTLVAVMGSVGGLTVVAIIAVMVYANVKKPKAKKLSSAPNDKVKGENIPIDAFVHDGPMSQPASRMDPYSQAPTPAPRNHPYLGPFGPGREPLHPESMDSRYQKGLRRTNF